MARKGTYTSTFIFDGKRRYAYGKTAEEAKENAIRKETLLKANVVELTDKTTVAQWSARWLSDYKDGAVSSAWYDAIEGILRNHILPEIGDRQMRHVTASDVQRLMNKCSGFSESHQKKIAQILLQIFDSAVENGIMVKVPTRRIKTSVKSRESFTRVLTKEERSLTLRTADKYPAEGLFFLIMLFCGCRPGEVSRLRMSDYNKSERILFVHEARKADGTTSAPKSSSGIRKIPVPSYLAERLDKLRKRQNELICTSAQGRPLTKTSQKRLWQKFRRHMDIENGASLFRNSVVKSTLADDLRPYCYRHTYCTDLRDAGVPLTVAKDLMGHADIKTTAHIYTHRTKESFEDARDKINALHSGDVDNF